MEQYPPLLFGAGREAAFERLLLFPDRSRLRTFVYVDGFNLYYGALRNTAYRWLDLGALCRMLLPRHDIVRINYYTARVRNRPEDPRVSSRQAVFLRALETIPGLEIHYGHFLEHIVPMRSVDNAGNPGRVVKVIKTEEKGSDVNLASHLLFDGFRDEYEAAVLVTNDSDLAEPVRLAKTLGKTVGILNPHDKPSRTLLPLADFYKPIRSGVLAACQFPPELKDAKGTIRKPPEW